MIAAVLWFFAGAFLGPLVFTVINLTLTSAGTGIGLALRKLSSKPGESFRLVFSAGAATALYGVFSWIGIRITLYLWEISHSGFKWGLVIASIYPAIMCLLYLATVPGLIAAAPEEEFEDEDLKAQVPLKMSFGFYVAAILIFIFANSCSIESVEVTPEDREQARLLHEILSDPEKMVNYGKTHISLGKIDEGIAIIEEARSRFPGNKTVEDAFRQVQTDFGR